MSSLRPSPFEYLVRTLLFCGTVLVVLYASGVVVYDKDTHTVKIATPKPKPRHPPQDWNQAKVAWMSYAEGMAAAKAVRRPICLVFYAEWCPHCRVFGAQFNDSKVVEKTTHFVMIRVNQDENRPLSKQYNTPYDEFIPRVFFLSADGAIYQMPYYDYEGNAPAKLLMAMDKVLQIQQ
jgi:thiol:disulfide interchange protein